MFNAFDPWVPPDPLAALQKAACGDLIAQPMPERGGTLRLGGDCGCGCSEAPDTAGEPSNAPPDDGQNGVEDSDLCK